MTTPEPQPRQRDLNDLTTREYAAFLAVGTHMPRSSAADLDYVVRTGALPEAAMADTLAFFTKEGGRVLDLFSGVGRMLNVASHSNRRAQGVDFNENNRAAYLNALQQDMFAVEQPFAVGDVLEWLRAAPPDDLYDFAFLDPPRFRSVPITPTALPNDFGTLKLDDYLDDLAVGVLAASSLVRPGKFVAVHLDLAFHKGTLYDIPGLLSARLLRNDKVRLRLRKDWLYDRTQTGFGNLGIAVANINTATLLAFECNQ